MASIIPHHLDGANIFPVIAGSVIELRIALQKNASSEHSTETDLTLTTINYHFQDEMGRSLDLALACDQQPVPDLDPMLVETLPPGLIDGVLSKAATAVRFLVAPPDATTLHFAPFSSDITCLSLSVEQNSCLWPAGDGAYIQTETEQAVESRSQVLRDRLKLTGQSEQTLQVLQDIPLRQIEAIHKRFEPRGSWQEALRATGQDAGIKDYYYRQKKLRSHGTTLKKVGFIGSERGFERLEGICHVFWLRTDIYKDQCVMIEPDLIIIETSAENEKGNTGWLLAFSSLDGKMPDKGRTFLSDVKTHNIPVHLWITEAPSQISKWNECSKEVQHVIAEDVCADWSVLGRNHQIIPRSVEPTACSVVGSQATNGHLMLVPVGADLLEFSEFAELLSRPSHFRTLVTDFRYQFSAKNIFDRIRNSDTDLINGCSRQQQRTLLQAATIVLLSSRSLRSDGEVETLAMDAIASGAIPIIFGAKRLDSNLLSALPYVLTKQDLFEIQGLLGIPWVWEREWRKLMCLIQKDYVWKSPHRKRLLGHDPFREDLDSPKISVISISKRPHLLSGILSTFRRQSWDNREIIIVINMDTPPSHFNELRENERIFILPSDKSIGECLNYGIAQSTGRYWVKMDDDDFYSSSYLEETAFYYRSSQADVVGRQSGYFYFSGQDKTKVRKSVLKNRFTLVESGGYIAGATLSADMHAHVAKFSCSDRSSADTNWVNKIKEGSWRVYSADSTSMIVFRDSEDSTHTWRIQSNASLIESFQSIYSGHLSELTEIQ